MRHPWSRSCALLAAAAVFAGAVVTGGSSTANAVEADRIDTLAGGAGEGAARAVGQDPLFVRADGHSVLVADGAHQVLRRIDLATGHEHVVAGIGGEFPVAEPGRPPLVTPDDGGPAAEAAFDRLGAFAKAPDGTLYLADDRRIRAISPAGVITTAVGTGARHTTFTAEDGSTSDLALAPVTSMAVDPEGRLWFAENRGGFNGGTVRRLDPDGVARLVIGMGTGTVDGAPGLDFQLRTPRGMFFDSDGVLVFVDTGEYSSTLLRYVPDRVTRGHSVNVRVNDMTPASDGDLLLAIYSSLWRWRPDGTTEPVPGTGGPGLGGTYASVSVLPDGRPVIARQGAYAVTVVDAGEEVVLAGDGSAGAAGDGGPATLSQLGNPGSLSRLPDGSVVVADETAHRVRRITPDGRMTTLAGTGNPTNTGDGGPAAQAAVRMPRAVEVGPDGSVYVTVRTEHNLFLVRKISPLGTISTYAGGGNTIEPTLDAREQSLGYVESLDVAPDGSLFVIRSCQILKIAPGPTPDAGGATTVYAGGHAYDPCEDSGDGGAATSARFLRPVGLALSPLGDLYVSDALANRVRRIDAAGVVHAFAGKDYSRSYDPSFAGDGGPALDAHLFHPAGLAVAADGGLLIADQHNLRVRRVAPDGDIGTVAGGRFKGPLGDGGPAVGASLYVPRDVEVGANGEVFVAEGGSPMFLYGYGHRRVRVVTRVPETPEEPSPSPSPTASPTASPSPTGSPTASPSPTGSPTVDEPSIQPLPPARLLDTRDGTGGLRGRLVDGAVSTFVATGRAGVPAAGVAAVVLNVTATGPLTPGHLTVFPGGSPPPGTSTLNYLTGQTVPNLVVVPVGPGGTISLRASAGSPHALADVAGYVPETARPELVPLPPSRILDSRDGTGGVSGRLLPGGTYDLRPLGRGGVPPSGVRAVLLNTTVAGAEQSGHLTVYPSGGTAPLASNLNFTRGQAVANLVLVPLGSNGEISLRANAGRPFAIADVVGYLAASDLPNAEPLPPARVLDTRDGTGGVNGRLVDGRPVTLDVTGRGGVPTAGVRAVVLNVTVTGASRSGHLTVHPADRELPVASNLNYRAGQTVPNLVLVPVDAEGQISLVANVGTPHAIADVVGYVRD